ncbi:MAG: sulfurtransferase [Microbacteriaceae bacterium]|jgi:thiosulfate/3-mercaptopyruvate sulfurtransferase|nr:sulfurtransferase [Microbacteriaceae bacterium]
MTVPGPLLSSPVVSTQWLADHLGADNLVVLDASALPFVAPNGRTGYLTGHEQYLVHGHVPGAIFADLIDEFSDPDGAYPFTRPTAGRFAAAAAAVGVTDHSTVVIYDSLAGQWASRVWWLFRGFGFDNAAVLDGGLMKWKAESREVDRGHVEATPGKFTPTERPSLWVDKAEVERIVAGDGAASLVCAVPSREFAGEEGRRARPGHIPGSLSVPAIGLVDAESNALLPVAELKRAFASALAAERVVAYCAGGISAAFDALALTLLGHRNVAVYDGSLNEWVDDAAAPVVTGA